MKIPDEKRRKLDDKVEQMMLLSYTSNGYRCYDFKNDKIIFSRDVVFKKFVDTFLLSPTIEIETEDIEENHEKELRRSNRSNKGVPPNRYG